MAKSNKGSLTVVLSSEIVEVLESLAAAHSGDPLKELKQAVSDRKFFSDKVAKGDRIILLNDAEPDVRTIVDFR